MRVTREMPIVRQQWDWVYEPCLELGFMPEALNAKRAYASEDAMPDIEAELAAAQMDTFDYED
jgi:hypothetical protein